MDSIRASLADNGFVRSDQGRVLGGVCSGLARKYNTDAWAMRLLVFALFVVLPGSPVLLYPLAWILMPEEGTPGSGPTYPQDVIRH